MSASGEKDINAKQFLLLLDEAEKAYRQKAFAEAESRYQSFLDWAGNAERFQAERAVCLQRIGDLSLATGRLDRAAESYQKLLTLALQHLGNDHQDVIAIQKNLAIVKAGQSLEAKKPVEFSGGNELSELFEPEAAPLASGLAVKPTAPALSRLKAERPSKDIWLRTAAGAGLVLLCLVAANAAGCLTILGNALRQSGQNQTAIAVYDMAFRLQPGSADIPFNRGCAKAQLNLLPDAIGDFRAAIDRAPNFADAYYSCGMAQFTMRNYDDAIKSFDKYISLEPNRPEGYVRRGISNAKLGHYGAAILDDDCAIKLDPANVEAVNNRNWATDLQCDEDMENQTEPSQQSSHGAQQGGEKAAIPSKTSRLAAQARKIAALDQSIASTPTAEAYCQRGSLFLIQNKSEEAMSDFDRAIELNPKSAATYLSRGLGYYQLSQFDKAIADYSKAIFYDAENASAYYRRGLAFDRRRKYALAASDYDNAAMLNPARAAVYTALANTDRRLIARDNASSDISTTAARTIPATQRTQSVNRSQNEQDAFSKLKALKGQSAPESPFRSHPAQTGGQAQQNHSPNSTSSTNSLPASQPLAITDGEAAYNQAKQDQWAGRWQVAISEFIALLKANSVPKKTSWIYHNLGQCYEQLGKIEDSMTCYNRGLQVNPREVTTLVSRGQLYWSHYHDYQRALADVNLALSIRPTWAEAVKFKNELDIVRTQAAR